MEALKDPKGDRQVKDIKPPPHKPLDEKILFPARNNIPDWKILREHLSKEGVIEKKHVIRIVNEAISIFKTEPNLVKIKDPVMVVGDMHGQFYDFLQIISLKEKREEKGKIEMKFLFLGDYVDRGNFGLELLVLLFALKVGYQLT
jgi:serine/threonine-protein phosphatase 2B catalytic subunit